MKPQSSESGEERASPALLGLGAHTFTEGARVEKSGAEVSASRASGKKPFSATFFRCGQPRGMSPRWAERAGHRVGVPEPQAQVWRPCGCSDCACGPATPSEGPSPQVMVTASAPADW